MEEGGGATKREGAACEVFPPPPPFFVGQKVSDPYMFLLEVRRPNESMVSLVLRRYMRGENGTESLVV